jgi:hypothetical protein
VTWLDPHVGAVVVEKLLAWRELTDDEMRAVARLLLEQPGVERARLQRQAIHLVEEIRRADPLLSIRQAAALAARRLPPDAPGAEAIRRWVRERAPFPHRE